MSDLRWLTPASHGRTPRVVVQWWCWPAVVLTLLWLILVDIATQGWVTSVDLDVRALVLPRPAWLVDLAHVMDQVGLGPVMITTVIVVSTLVSRSQRSWRPLGLVLGSLLALYAVIWPVKLLVGRGQAVHDVVAVAAGGQAWPSGHAANVAFGMVMLTHLLRLWTRRSISQRIPVALVAGPSLVMAATSLVLGYHWASDLVAGMLFGLLVGELAVHLDVRLRRRRERLAAVALASRRPEHSFSTSEELATAS